MAGRLGFGAPIPFDLPTAVSQVTNGGGSRAGGFKDDVELANAAYGQGETFVTPLQMALVAATVANDGVLMRPRLVTSLTGKSGTRTIGPEEMRRVSRRPTRRRSARDGAGRRGQLGRLFTPARRCRASRRPASPARRSWAARASRTRGSSASRPADDPQVAIAVLVEQGGRGGEGAAPLAGRADGAYSASELTEMTGPPRPATGDRRTAREPRPLIERMGLAAIALVLAALFGAWRWRRGSGGELFLAAMGAIGCLMTFWVGR